MGDYLTRLRGRARPRGGGHLGGLARDSGWVAIWQGSQALVDLLLIPLIIYFLGLQEYGRFALALAAVSFAGELLSLRVGIAATTFGARALEGDPRRAAGIFQLTYLFDAGTAFLAFGLILGLAPFVGEPLIGSDGALLLIVYGLWLLPKSADATSFVILRLLDRFRFIAIFTVVTELTRLALVVASLVIFDSLIAALIALVVTKAFVGLAQLIAAAGTFNRRTSGQRLFAPAVETVPREERRAFLRTIFHTNIFSYQQLVQVQVPPLVLGFVAGASETAVYKIGIAAAAAVGKVVDPARGALMARISRIWASGRVGEVRHLVAQVTKISLPVVLLVLGAVVLLRAPIIDFLGRGEVGKDAETVLIFGALAQAAFAAAFWRTTVLFVAGRTGLVAKMAIVGIVVQLVGLFILVPVEGAVGAGISLLATRLLVDGSLSVLAVRALNQTPSGEAERANARP